MIPTNDFGNVTKWPWRNTDPKHTGKEWAYIPANPKTPQEVMNGEAFHIVAIGEDFSKHHVATTWYRTSMGEAEANTKLLASALLQYQHHRTNSEIAQEAMMEITDVLDAFQETGELDQDALDLARYKLLAIVKNCNEAIGTSGVIQESEY